MTDAWKDFEDNFSRSSDHACLGSQARLGGERETHKGYERNHGGPHRPHGTHITEHSRKRVPTASERQREVVTASKNGHRQPHSARASWALTPLHLPAREGIDAGTHGGKDPVSHCHDETCDHWCGYPAERAAASQLEAALAPLGNQNGDSLVPEKRS